MANHAQKRCFERVRGAGEGGADRAAVTGSGARGELRPRGFVLGVALGADRLLDQGLLDFRLGGHAGSQVLRHVALADHVVGIHSGERRQVAHVAEVLLRHGVVQQEVQVHVSQHGVFATGHHTHAVVRHEVLAGRRVPEAQHRRVRAVGQVAGVGLDEVGAPRVGDGRGALGDVLVTVDVHLHVHQIDQFGQVGECLVDQLLVGGVHVEQPLAHHRHHQGLALVVEHRYLALELGGVPQRVPAVLVHLRRVDAVGAIADAGAEVVVGHRVAGALVVPRVLQRPEHVRQVRDVGLVQRLDHTAGDEAVDGGAGHGVVHIGLHGLGRQLGDGLGVGGERGEFHLHAELRFEVGDHIGVHIRVVVEDAQRALFGLQPVGDGLRELAAGGTVAAPAGLQQRHPDAQQGAELNGPGEKIATGRGHVVPPRVV
jgi:hypothetical protein